jgi:hypothetical protein
VRRFYWPCALLAAGFIAWAHVHTDEIPVIFGFLIILGMLLGAAFRGRFVCSWLLLGAAVPIMELLVHFALVRAPYPASSLSSIAVIAWVAMAPPLIGVALGTWIRSVYGRRANPGCDT